MITSVSNTSTPLSQTTATANSSNSTSFQAQLDAFYEIHQRSQITGVPTSIYNASLEKLGFDTKDTWAGMKAINLLKEHGYDTGKPSDEAILKYGSIDQEHGNKSYMKNGVTEASSALADELKILNEETEGAYEGARNYYDVAAIRSGEKSATAFSSNTPVSSVSTSTEPEATQPASPAPAASTSTADTLSLMLKQLDTLSPKETMGLLEAFLKKLG